MLSESIIRFKRQIISVEQDRTTNKAPEFPFWTLTINPRLHFQTLELPSFVTCLYLVIVENTQYTWCARKLGRPKKMLSTYHPFLAESSYHTISNDSEFTKRVHHAAQDVSSESVRYFYCWSVSWLVVGLGRCDNCLRQPQEDRRSEKSETKYKMVARSWILLWFWKNVYGWELQIQICDFQGRRRLTHKSWLTHGVGSYIISTVYF